MNAQLKKEKNTIRNGKETTTQLRNDELLDLFVYQAYRTGNNHYNVSYAIVNICVLTLQNSDAIYHRMLCEKFMVGAFRSYIRKWVMKNYGRIKKYFSSSTQGTHQDMMDVYQEVWICFFDLIRKFDTKNDVYFVVYLAKYLFYWLNNRYKINKKEQIEMLSLNAVVASSDDSSPLTLMDTLQSIKARSVTNLDDDVCLEDKMIHKFMMDDFERKVLCNDVNFKSKRIQKTYSKVYTFFFIEGKSNKSDLARQMKISQQKVRYYLDKIARMFYVYSSESYRK